MSPDPRASTDLAADEAQSLLVILSEYCWCELESLPLQQYGLGASQ